MSRFLPSVAPDIRAGHKADLKAIAAVMPYLWPRDDPGMRWRVVLSVGILFLTAILNALLPVLFSIAIDRLTPAGTSLLIVAPVALLVGYGFIFWFSRALNELRWILFGPLEQRVRRRLGLAVFDHLHTLSLRYHLSRRTGMLSRTQERGLEATAELLFNLVFVIAPLITEIVIITAIVLARFEAHFAIIMAVTLSLFLFAVIFGSEILRRYQRPAVIKASEAHGKAIDSLINYETVKYFGNEDYVSVRYDRELAEAERLTVRSLVFRSLLGVAQMTVLGIGAGAIVVLGGMDVAAGAMTIGAFVLINTYLLQLVRPLERLGNLYRSIKQALIDLEQMIRIFDEKPEVTDRADAIPLPDGDGAIRFENVSFAYDPRRPILKNVSFEVEAGHKLALVGPSGGGKTTIGRLLFRFYDPAEGTVRIDGHDISRLTQHSVRAAIGRRNRGRRGNGPDIDLHRQPARQAADGRRRTRAETVRRRKTAGRDRPRGAETAAYFPVRRGNVGPGQPYRAGNPAEPDRGIARIDHRCDRAPAVHRGRCGTDPVCRERRNCRARVAPAVAGHAGKLRRPVGTPAAAGH